MKVCWNQPVAMPQAGFGERYLHSSVFEMAAAYLFHIVKNHPFVDGNKRTGAVAAFTFLKLNQMTLNAGESKFERLVRETAEGKVGKEKIAEFFQKNSKRGR
jgi:death on curing protein